MAELKAIIDYLAGEFEIADFPDTCLNGLQIEGRSEVRHVAASVDAGLSVAQAARDCKADMLVVHHGLFWTKPIPLSGPKREFCKTLLAADISLVALHLPLDAHLKLGNNALLAARLDLSDVCGAAPYQGANIGVIGTNTKKLSCGEISKRLGALGGCVPGFVELKFGPEIPKRVCIVSGAGADQLYNFQSENFDTLVSGEPRQFAFHYCKENGLNAFFPGHYATETVGVQAVARALAEKFGVTWEFIDQPTGI